MFPARYVVAPKLGRHTGPSSAKAIVIGVETARPSWLDGPGAHPPGSDDGTYPGERLGLPQAGPRSVGGFGRRVGAIFVDWFAALLIVGLFTGRRPLTPGHSSTLTLLVFGLEYLILVTLLGRTIGMRLFGIGVMRLDGRRVPFRWIVVRTLLLVLVVPAVIYDRDQRGLHDRAAGCVVVRF
jgi:RDD family